MPDAAVSTRVPDYADVVVVGAGIAGLVAADTLRRAGLDVVVLEQAAAVGGRMSSAAVPGGTLELGAQFLSTGYDLLPAYLDDLGLRPRATSSTSAIWLSGRLRTMRSDGPASLPSLVSGGVVAPWMVPVATRALWRLRQQRRPAVDLGQWADVGNLPAAVWCHSMLGRAITTRVMSPTLFGLYFQTLQENSGALPAAVATFLGGRVLTLDGGLGSLPAALAARLTVHTGVEVHQVSGGSTPGRAGVQPVKVRHSCGVTTARRVILAIPGTATRRVYLDASAAEIRLATTPYSPGLVVGLSMARRLADSELGGAYGVLMPAQASVAGFAVSSRSGAAAPARDLVTVLFGPSATRVLGQRTDEQIVAAAVKALTTLAPDLGHEVTSGRAAKYDQAMPTVPVGHPERVQRYRESLPKTAPIVLAGDYLGFPWTDSAAFNGLWAAQRVLPA